MSTRLPMGSDWPHEASTVRTAINLSSGATLTLAGATGECICVSEYALTSDGIGTYTWLGDAVALSGAMSIAQGQLHHVKGAMNTPSAITSGDGRALKLTAAGARITGYVITYVVDSAV